MYLQTINTGYIGLTIVAIIATIVSVYYYFKQIAADVFFILQKKLALAKNLMIKGRGALAASIVGAHRFVMATISAM